MSTDAEGFPLDRRLDRADAVIAFADTASDGPAVVLTHGAGMDHTMWEEQAVALADADYRVILWDIRGHGESTLAPHVRFTAADALEDLAALLTECRVDKAVLVGHSLGGNLSQAFVRSHPDRAVGLIVVDATWNTGPLSRLERFALRLAAPSLALIPARTLPRLMARASAITPSAIRRTQRVFTRMPKRRFLEVWTATVSFVAPDPEYRSPVPLALMRGAEDRTGNIATAMPRWAHAENVAEHVIPDAGHVVTWDAPDASSRTLRQILDRWRRRASTSGQSAPG